MKARLLVLLLLISSTPFASFSQNPDSIFIRKIFDESLESGHAYKNLRVLCKSIGARLSGSNNAAKAVKWTKQLMEEYGFDTVYLQPVMVPHWERGGKEEAFFEIGNRQTMVPIAALGGSVATPKAGLKAKVIEVKDFEQLRAMGEAKVKGNIVFFNRAFDNKPIEPFVSYGRAVDQRVHGAVEAARLGAVGVIVRSMTHVIDDNPHTGSLRYSDEVTKIPAAAISTKAAENLSTELKKSEELRFYFKQQCRTLPDVLSYNVIGELKGRQSNEIIAVGGHLDSWDLAEGAHDDGAGVVQSIEVLRILKSLNYRPNATVRAVLFMNEENGLKGGLKYAELAGAKKELHLAAIESDAGGFSPRGFSIQDDAQKVALVKKSWGALLAPYGLTQITEGEGGADIGPLKKVDHKSVLIGFRPDPQRYFDIHHSTADMFENVNKRELELGAGSMAALIYLIDKYKL